MASGNLPSTEYYSETFASGFCFRINIAANQTVVLPERSVQRAAAIFTNLGGLYFYDRWANISTINNDSNITITTTGTTNDLGSLKIKNNTNVYRQVAIFFPYPLFVSYTTEE